MRLHEVTTCIQAQLGFNCNLTCIIFYVKCEGARKDRIHVVVDATLLSRGVNR